MSNTSINGVLAPKKISAPGKNTELSSADKKTFNNCKYKGGWFPKKYREWTNLTNFINSGTAQCGHGTLYIGSPTGDRPQPAPIHISDFKHSLQKNDKVHSITVSFKCRVLNVTDGGHAWTNNLAESDLAKIQGYKIWFGPKNPDNALSSVKKSNKKFKYGGKTKNSYNWENVSETFKDVSIDDIFNKNFGLNIAFGANCSLPSTQCDLFIKSLKISIVYENSKKYIEGTSNPGSLYTSKEDSCYTTITQRVEAGYIKDNKKIPVSEAPAKLGSKIAVLNYPPGVTVEKINSNDNSTTFKITDKTETTGQKIVTYYLTDDKTKTCKVYYTANQRSKPSFAVETEYKANEDFKEDKPYIIFKNGCAPFIKVYIDTLNSTPIYLPVANPNSTTNLLDQAAIQTFHNGIKNLSCGTHTLYFQRGNENSAEILKNNIDITIKPMEYQFEIYSESNPTLTYNQTKNQANRYETIKIKRIDNEPIAVIPTLQIIDETNVYGQIHEVNNVKKGDIIEHQIDKYYSGTFYIKIVDRNATCKTQNQIFGQININSSHKQNFDYLFTRGEDGTAFDFDYLVAWEGDNIKEPIEISDIQLYNSDADIRICSSEAQSGLSQIGLINLRVTNRTANKLFENIKIELNTLTLNDDLDKEVTTTEWTLPNGIFNQFYALFNDYNKDIIKNVSVENLTPDNDLVDEENVYLHIQSLDAGDSIDILLPFRSTVEKEVYLQYLLFEEPQKIYNIEDCKDAPESPDQPTDIKISVLDSMLTQLDIAGEIDLLALNDSYECPTECYTTTETSDLHSGGITYTITNIDTNDFSDTFVNTEIENSNELQPYAYKLKNSDEIYDLYDENGILKEQDMESPIQWSQETRIIEEILTKQLIYCNIQFPNHEESELIQRTSSNGLAEFYIPIPHTIDKSYTIDELLSEVVFFHYKGDNKYNANILTKKEGYPPVNDDINKYKSILRYKDNYRRYKPGQVAHIPIYLSANVPIIKNKITFNAALKNTGSSDYVTIFYKICNINDDKGIFKTKFKTNNDLLIPNEITKDIYCGIDTEIKVGSKIEKKVIESEKINVLYIDVHNQLKMNKDVLIKIDIGEHIDFSGTYQFLDINIDDGDYSVENNDGNVVILWQIGEMESYQKNRGIIKIKANNIGVSDIIIDAYDYLHNPNKDNPIDAGHHCEKCPELNSYKLKDSPWENIDGKWYKLINGVYKRRVLVNGVLEWVNKDE